MKQYIPSWMELPELGSVRELVNREGELKALGVVYGHLPKERMVLIRELKLSEKGTIGYVTFDDDKSIGGCDG